ncbi:MAG: hypothetical protein Q9M43_12420 [Sulfurimonas sp.]|nr:hypothetical protein [Sulfurimonas sp.]
MVIFYLLLFILFLGKSFKTTVLRFETSTLQEFIKEDAGIKESYEDLEFRLLNNIDTVAFGKRALANDADVTLGQSHFFRKKISYAKLSEDTISDEKNILRK